MRMLTSNMQDNLFLYVKHLVLQKHGRKLVLILVMIIQGKRLGHLGVDGVGQILEDVLTGVGGVGGDFPLFQQSARGGEQSDLGRGAAEVDAECVFFHNSFTPFFCGGRPPVII